MPDDVPARLGRRQFVKAAGAVASAAGFGSVVGATPGRSPGPKAEELLVGISPALSDWRETVEEAIPGEATVVHGNETLGYVAVRIPDVGSDAARNRIDDALTRLQGVKYVERNRTYSTFQEPDDTRFDSQYAPQQVNSNDAWETTFGDSDVTIAVVDTGVQYDHPDLATNFASTPGTDFVDGDDDPYPDDPETEFHGTHVAGCAAGVVDNGTGIAGQGNSTLVSARALDENGSGSTSDVADAVQWAADQGADVINMSLGGGGGRQTLKNAVSYAQVAGSLVVCAAGNDGSEGVAYPAAYPECVAVSAVDSDENFARFSQYGDSVELCAPGVSVLSTTTEERGSYERLSGTSMATPIVSGVAGLTLAQWPDLSNDALRRHLKETARDIGLAAPRQGSGQVDAHGAVTTDPADGGDSRDSTATTVSDSLNGFWDADGWAYTWEFDDPTDVTVELDGPSGADFDLYVNTGTTKDAMPWNYDYAATSLDSREHIAIQGVDDSTAMQLTVNSFLGSGDYDLTITEYTEG
ncbi:S8 family serine peptidase [Haloarchaeobius sp. DT45]|uniref:S8 family serine peptidase n=1 Tax=Haloarchaeobius sp. DT45 TaxID=3446116 RepID=UPI003F6D8093